MDPQSFRNPIWKKVEYIYYPKSEDEDESQGILDGVTTPIPTARGRCHEARSEKKESGDRKESRELESVMLGVAGLWLLAGQRRRAE